MSYKLDTDAARNADSTGSIITAMGKYVGEITQAYAVTATTGTKGLGIQFLSNGQYANFTLYTDKADGTPLMGRDQVMAIMTCVSLRDMPSQAGKILKWDNDAKKEIEVSAEVYPALKNKKIGIVFETESYEKRNGDEASKVVPKMFFQAATEFTASEILDKVTAPKNLPLVIASLKHRPLRKPSAAPVRQTSQSFSQSPSDLDDDILF